MDVIAKSKKVTLGDTVAEYKGSCLHIFLSFETPFPCRKNKGPVLHNNNNQTSAPFM